MTKSEAQSMLLRIVAAGRLPDQHDVRLAEVCADFLKTDEASESLKAVRQRHRILILNRGKASGGAK